MEFPGIRWAITWDNPRALGKLPSSVVDVAPVLAARWHELRAPADGIVPFDRASLLRKLGWCDANGHASGDSYKRLDRALTYLAHTVYVRLDAGPRDLCRPMGYLPNNRVRMVEDFDVRGRAGQPWVRLSAEYLRSFLPEEAVPTDLVALRSVSDGLPRVFVRLLAALRHERQFAVSAPELFARVGSIVRDPSLGRLRGGTMWKALLELTKGKPGVQPVLAEEPKVIALLGRDPRNVFDAPSVLEFTFSGDPELREHEFALIAQAVAHGVLRPVARRLALDTPAELGNVLGWLRADPKKRPNNPAGYIVSAVRDRWDVAQYPPPG